MAALWRDTPLLRRRALYQAALFACFSLYWTAVPLLLAGPGFGYTQREIGWFTLAGVAGALAAPVAGRMADRGHGQRATGLIDGAGGGVVRASWIGGHGSVAALLAAGVALDLGVQANLVIGQRAIFGLGAEVRSRLNAVYMATFFAGGALGSALASPAQAHGGWPLVCAIGLAFAAVALLYFLAGEAKREKPLAA